MNELALFAGAGGGLLASGLLGWRPICAVEISPYCRDVLGQRQTDGAIPPFPIWDDVRTFDGLAWKGRVDVVSGGLPCQAYSTAARGANCADDLWPEMRRIVAETAPRYVFAENPSGGAIGAAAEDLEEMGYQTRCVALSAQHLGADHLRHRYWLLAYADNESKLPGSIDAEMGVVPKFHRGVWEDFPEHSRVADGVANWVDRLEATGNGQVPLVALVAWNILIGSVPPKICEPPTSVCVCGHSDASHDRYVGDCRFTDESGFCLCKGFLGNNEVKHG